MFFLIAWPWMALIPAVLFLALNVRARRRTVAVTGVLWALYACYEYAMLRRWLCSGECNIRVDLLLIHAVLIVLSFATVVSLVRARKAAG